MKILVIGGSGFLGYYIVQKLKTHNDVEFTYFKHKIPELNGHYLDITNKKTTIELISKINPDVVIHTPALTVDLSETDKKFAEQNFVITCR